MITILDTDIMGDQIMNHKVTHVDREASVFEACKLMQKFHTTELLVTAEANGMLLPLGLLTAKDIVTLVIAAELDPAVLTTGDIALSGIAAAYADDGDAEKPRCSQQDNSLTLAVVDGDGRLVGTVRPDEFMGAISH